MTQINICECTEKYFDARTEKHTDSADYLAEMMSNCLSVFLKHGP